MRIKRLELYNFGVYAGKNTFEFGGEKPIVLIGGMNGRGKTTLLEAVLLSLYGSNSVAYLESNQKSYSQYLRAFVNRSAEDDRCSVEMEFELNNNENETYVVKREWDAFIKRKKDEITVFKDGIYNEFLTNNWPMFVESILPSALSSFFFFDGEKIAELAVDNTNIQLKNSIRSMLGISVLDVLENDIIRSLKKISKSEEGNETAEGVERLRAEKERTADELSRIECEIEETSGELVKNTDRLEQLHQQYIAKGGDAFEKREEGVKRKASLNAEKLSLEDSLYELVCDELPLVLVKDLIQEVKLQGLDEHNDMIMRQAVTKLDDLFNVFSEGYKGDTKAGREFVEFVKERTNNDEIDHIYELSDQALFQVNNLIERTLDVVKNDANSILKSKKSIGKQIDELESYLSLDIDDKELKSIYKKIKEVEKKIIDNQVRISELELSRAEASSKAAAAASEFSKYVEAYLSTAELRDSTERTIKYSNIALNVLAKYKVELQRRKTDILAKTITSCYRKLANKKNLIKKIVMDPETLDLTYLSDEDSVVPKESLSAGEKQLMVVSILWALGICSKKKLPVIIDTPLSRLDSLHRTSLIKTYFPNASEQTIILSTDSEVDSNYYQIMKENIGDEFTLNYNEETRSTSIKRGYLIGA